MIWRPWRRVRELEGEVAWYRAQCERLEGRCERLFGLLERVQGQMERRLAELKKG